MNYLYTLFMGSFLMLLPLHITPMITIRNETGKLALKVTAVYIDDAVIVTTNTGEKKLYESIWNKH